MSKNKILIIGSGKDILKTFRYTFQNHQIENLSFRDSWKNLKRIKKKEKILVSGFHFEMCNMKYKDFLKYIDEYYKFLKYLKNNCKILYFVSTDLSVKLSVSRVAFFYFKILSKLRNKPINGIKILMFYTLIGFTSNNENKLKNTLLKLLNIKTMNYKKMKFLLNKNFILKDYRINFLFLKIPRSRGFDRIIRLFIDLIFFKIIRNDN